MRILAFLQNPSIHHISLTTDIERYATDVVFRREVMARSQTGGRLIVAWGKNWFDYVHWDNVSTNPGDYDLKRSVVGNRKHCVDAILEVNPHIVVTYGTYAKNTIDRINIYATDIVVFNFRHPSAWGITSQELKRDADLVKIWVRKYISSQDRPVLEKLLGCSI